MGTQYRSAGTRESLLRALENNLFLIVYDCETTGLSPDDNHIIELSARLCSTYEDGLIEVDSKNWYVNPGYALPEKITELTGITDDFLADKPFEKDVAEEIIAYFGNEAVAGYCNNRFDDKFMANMYRRYGKTFEPKESVDVFPIVKNLVEPEEAENYKLETMARHFGIADEISRFHNSEGDTMATMLVLNRCVELCKKRMKEENPHLVKCKVNGAAYWKNPRNWKQQRVYVETDQTTFYYDIIRKAWDTKAVNDRLGKYDMEDMISQVLAITGAKDEAELAKFRGRVRTGAQAPGQAQGQTQGQAAAS